MSDAYLGEIRIFAGNFAPAGWAFCIGQLLPIAQNTALFAVIGTQYGGNGTTNFALPNLSGAAPMHQGDGAGLTSRSVGELVGTQSVTLTMSEMPVHSHVPQAYANAGSSDDPTNRVWAEAPGVGRPRPVQPAWYSTTPNVQMSPNALSVTGGSQPHNNMQPSLALNFIICLNGIFPSRA
jgi:microcystin-dependent protein